MPNKATNGVHFTANRRQNGLATLVSIASLRYHLKTASGNCAEKSSENLR